MRKSLVLLSLGVSLLGFGLIDTVSSAAAQNANRRRSQLNRSGSAYRGSRGRGVYRGNRGYRGGYRGSRYGYRGSRYGYRGSRYGYRGSRYGYGGRYGYRSPYRYGGYRSYGYYPRSYWPFTYGYGYGYGYPYYGYSSYLPYRYGTSVVVVDSQDGYGAYRGAVRTQIKPVETQVYVDGYYAGIVDDYDGMFQRLYLEEGEHTIEFRLKGHRLFSQSLFVEAGRTQKIHHTMELLGPGEAEAPPPNPRTRSRANLEADDRYQAPRPSSPPPPQRPAEPRQPERPQPPERPRARSGVTFPAPHAYGRLVLRVQPQNAEVWIDGELWGSLEGLGEMTIHLSVGEHMVEIRSQGYQGFKQTIDVRDGRETPLNVHLNGGAGREL